MERLIVSDGQPSRGHRKNIFNSEFQYCGIGTGPHKELDNIIILDYAKEILKDGELPSMNITVQEEVPQELIDKMCKYEIDINPVVVNREDGAGHREDQS